MHIIKLNAIDSTNSFLKEKASEKELSDFTVVVTKQQLQGRGQRGSQWQSQPGKNLTFSVFKKVYPLEVIQRFYINMIVSNAIYEVLEKLNLQNLSVKWPNDILSGDQKIGGILIENFLKSTTINYSVIGIGLNVNQVFFEGLTKASSLRNLSGKIYDLDEILLSILQSLKVNFNKLLDTNQLNTIKNDYESRLFRKNKPSTFISSNGKQFPGFIKGVNDEGKLQVLLEDQITEEFDMKEIRLLY